MSRRRGARARSLSCCCRTTASTVDRKLAARVAGIDVILTGAHPRCAARGHAGRQDPAGRVGQPRQVSLPPRSRRAGRRGARLPLQADPAVRRRDRRPTPRCRPRSSRRARRSLAELAREVGRTDSLLYRRGNFNGTFDDLICAALIEERDAEIALSPGFRWGTSVLPGSRDHRGGHPQRDRDHLSEGLPHDR